jgi:hypothetical protein
MEKGIVKKEQLQDLTKSQLAKIDGNHLLKALGTNTAYNKHVPSTVKEAQEGVAISVINRHNPALLELSIGVLLEDLARSFNAQWSDRIMLSIVDRITNKYWYFKIEEIAFVFSNAIDGIYGKVYGQIQISTVMEWLHEYDVNERLYYHESRNNIHKESAGRYFEEKEHKDYVDIRNQTKEMEKKYIASRDAKMKVFKDNQNN